MKWWLQVKLESDLELQIMEKMTQFGIALNSVMLRHVRYSPLWENQILMWICNGCAHCKNRYVVVRLSGAFLILKVMEVLQR